MFFSLSDWDNLKPSLSADGWDGDTMPGFIDLLDAIAAQGYNTVEFHISHPLVVGAVWFTDEYYFTVTPLAYDLATLDGQFVLPDGSSYRLDDLDEVSYDEMTDYFDGIIEVDGDTMLGVKRKRQQNRKLTPPPRCRYPPRRAIFLPSSSGVFHERPFLSGQLA